MTKEKDSLFGRAADAALDWLEQLVPDADATRPAAPASPQSPQAPSVDPPIDQRLVTTEPAIAPVAPPSGKSPSFTADKIIVPAAKAGAWVIKNLHALNRPFYGAEVAGGLVGAAAVEASALLPTTTTQDFEPFTPEAPSAPSDLNPHYQTRVDRKAGSLKTVRDHQYIMAKYATQPIAPGSTMTRLEFSEQTFSKTNLPPELKSLLPFVPFQESGYKLTTPPRRPAQGPWQFIPGTARKYGLIEGTKGQRGYRDRRSDFVAATEAAARYFEFIYRDLSSDPNYQILKQRYDLTPDDFLVPATINAFNSGEGHMRHALKIMATEPSIREEVDSYVASGRRGLYSYMTDVYIYDFRKWQAPLFRPPYYHEDSADYVYCIEGFYRVHGSPASPVVSSPPSPPSATPALSAPTQINVRGAALLGGAVAGTAFAAAHLKARSQLSRRGFLAMAGHTTVAAAAGMAGGSLDALYGGVDRLIDSNDSHISRIDSPLGLSLYEEPIAAVRAEAGFSHDQLKRYPFNQKMADTAYSLYKETSDTDYLILAEYYYRHALELAEGQKGGRYALPVGGLTKVEERIRYCASAHSIVDSEF